MRTLLHNLGLAILTRISDMYENIMDSNLHRAVFQEMGQTNTSTDQRLSKDIESGYGVLLPWNVNSDIA